MEKEWEDLPEEVLKRTAFEVKVESRAHAHQRIRWKGKRCGNVTVVLRTALRGV